MKKIICVYLNVQLCKADVVYGENVGDGPYSLLFILNI